MSDIRLSIKIENSKPFELNQLTSSLNSLAKEFDVFCKDHNIKKSDRKLEIVKLDKGSLLIELIPFVVPLINEINTVYMFGEKLINTINFFSGKGGDKPKIGKQSCDNISNFMEVTANDNGGNLILNVVGDNNKIIVGSEISNLEANATQNGLRKHKDTLLEESPEIYTKEAFYWSVASFSDVTEKSADRGVALKINEKAHKIIFANDTDKKMMTTFNASLKSDWQNLIYIVDIEVTRVQESIKIYKILKVHYDDTIIG